MTDQNIQEDDDIDIKPIGAINITLKKNFFPAHF
jgi:hypothetical protein